jgi:hypothetical protein
MNCVDSLRAQTAEMRNIPGMGVISQTSPSLQTFEGNVIILEAMCEGYDLLDGKYKEMIPDPSKKTSRDKFAALTSLLKRKGVWKEDRPYLGKI